MWQDVGIRASIQRFPYSAFRPNLVNRTAKGIWAWACGPASFEPINSLGRIWNSKSSAYNGFEHPIMQDWIEQAQAEQDTEKAVGHRGADAQVYVR